MIGCTRSGAPERSRGAIIFRRFIPGRSTERGALPLVGSASMELSSTLKLWMWGDKRTRFSRPPFQRSRIFSSGISRPLSRPGPPPDEVQLRAFQSAKPKIQSMPAPCRFHQQTGDGPSPKRGLKAVVLPLVDRLFQQRLANLPGVSVSQGQRGVGVQGPDFPGNGIRVEDVQALRLEFPFADARFASTIDSSKDISWSVIRIHSLFGYFV